MAMELYYRNAEIKLIQRQLWLSKEQRSRMTVVTGKSGAGKTALVCKALEKEPFLYFRAGGKTSHLLLQEYKNQVSEKLGLYIPSKVVTFPTLLSHLFDSAYKRHMSIIIDNFDLLASKEPDFVPFLADLWDENRRGSHVNLILITRNIFVTNQIFDNQESPLVNAADCRITLNYFTVSQLKELLLYKGPNHTSEDLLALYMTTGGMPALTMSVLKATDCSKEQIYKYLLSPDSPCESAARALLADTLGKNSEVYLSILQLIACGHQSQAAIEAGLGGIIIGGHLAKLETEYQLVTKMRPVLADAASRNVVRYNITNLFLLFWLKYIESNRATIETSGYETIIPKALADFEPSGRDVLLRYFIQKFSEENSITAIGGDWPAVKPSRNQSRRRGYYLSNTSKSRTSVAPKKSNSPKVAAPEEDNQTYIVALADRKNKALFADVCLHASDFKKAPFLERLATLKKGPLKGCTIDSRVFTIEDM